MRVHGFVDLAEPVDAIYTSDAQRCQKLADRLSRALGVARPNVDSNLREQNMGTWEHRSWPAIRAESPAQVDQFWRNYVDTAPPEGESFAQVIARARAFWRGAVEARLSASAPRSQGAGGCPVRIVVVTHAGIIRALVGEALGMAADQRLRLGPPPGSETRMSVTREGAVLSAFGLEPGCRACAR